MGSAKFAISGLRSELPGRGSQAPRVLGSGDAVIVHVARVDGECEEPLGRLYEEVASGGV